MPLSDPPNPPRRLLGIDYGLKRIGLAISDPEGRLAVPLDTLERRDDRWAARRIRELVEREGVGALVLGDPRRLDGSPGDLAERVDRFARRLEATTGLPVARVDESLTSVEAERRLRRAGADPAPETGRLDALAAQILLQQALDEGAAPPRAERPGEGPDRPSSSSPRADDPAPRSSHPLPEDP